MKDITENKGLILGLFMVAAVLTVGLVAEGQEKTGLVRIQGRTYTEASPPEPATAEPDDEGEYADIKDEDYNGTRRVRTLIIDGNFFPAAQFRLADADACLLRHYHKHGPAVGIDISVTFIDAEISIDPINEDPSYVRRRESLKVIKDDPAPTRCGFGDESSLKVFDLLINDAEAEMLGLAPEAEAE